MLSSLRDWLSSSYNDGALPNNKAARIVMLLSMASIILLFYLHGKANAPAKDTVNGVYFNRCCGEIVLRNGDLSYKNKHYHYDLENMKFGLTAYVQAKLTPVGIEDSSEQTALGFSGRGKSRSFDTVIGMEEYSFLRIR